MSHPPPNNWSRPADIKARIRRRWDRGEFLADRIMGGSLFPLRISIPGPSSAQITADFGAAREWIATWRDQNAIPCEWRDFSHRLFGDNQMPSAALFPDAQAVLRLLGVRHDWDIYQNLADQCLAEFPALRGWLAKRPFVALGLAGDWARILTTLGWLRDHPRCNRYVRQIDAPGIHTKWIESHRGTLSELLDIILPAEAIDFSARGCAGFNRRYGFRDKPERIRIRFLDPTIAIQPEHIGMDLTLDATAFAMLNPAVTRVFITENEINFLAFPNCARSLVIFGAGYGWSALAEAAWLQDREIHYWGDIDTHGFAILDQLRAHHPHVRSLLMGCEILLAFPDEWTLEPSPVRHELQRLTPAERATWDLLRNTTPAPRLEQEKLPFHLLLDALRADGLT